MRVVTFFLLSRTHKSKRIWTKRDRDGKAERQHDRKFLYGLKMLGRSFCEWFCPVNAVAMKRNFRDVL